MATPKNKKKFTADPALAKANMAMAMEKLQAGLDSIATPEGIKQHLTFSARGNLSRYSARNQILIHMQCPGAFMVGGYHFWIKRGRRPIAGAGCRILAPSIFTKKVEASDEQYQEIMGSPREEGDPKLELEKQMRGYKTIVVWDIQQTADAKGNPYDGPVPGMGASTGVSAGLTLPFLTTDDEDERAAGLDDLVRAFMRSKGVTVTKECRGPEYGSYNPSKNTLCISPRFDPLTTCATTIHEAAHWQEFATDSRSGYNLGELVAESVAYIVLQRYGLDTSSFSFRYIKNYGGDQKMLQKGLAAIQKISQTLVAAIEEDDDEEDASAD